MVKQYVDVTLDKNKITTSYYDTDTGKKHIKDVRSINNLGLFIKTKKDSEYKSFIGNKNLKKINFENIKDYKNFMYSHDGVDGLDVYGDFSLDKQWIHEQYDGELKMNSSILNIGYVDIETTVSDGQPDPINTPERITSIVFYASKSDKYYIFCDKKIEGKYFKDEDQSKLIYHYYSPDIVGEFQMLDDYIHTINTIEKVDILSAYFGNLFDYRYIYNRIGKIEDMKPGNPGLQKIDLIQSDVSPIGVAYTTKKGKLYVQGVQYLDYFDVYKKYTYGSPESWKLDFIATKELGVGKIKFDGGFMHLYNTNYEKYVFYNYIDVKRLVQLDEKLRFMELHVELSYLAKQNFEDTISPVRTWESILFGHLKEKFKVIDPKQQNIKQKYIGAYTHEPVPEFYNYPMSFDLNSLYPHLIMMYYISPETIISEKQLREMFPNNKTIDVLFELKSDLEYVSNTLPYDKKAVAKAYDKVGDMLINQEFDLSFLKEKNITMSPSIEFFKKDEEAVLPYFMEHFYDMRKVIKKKKLIMEDEIQILKNNGSVSEFEKYRKKYEELSKLDNMSDMILEMETLTKRWGLKEKAYKILLNSVYGAFGNMYFRFFDIRLAKSITSGGRLAIRSLIKKVEADLRTLYKTFTGKKWTGVNFFTYSDTDSIYLNTEPLIPAMMHMYKPIIKYALRKKDEKIIDELDDCDFWDNIQYHFDEKTEIVNKYFKPHDMLENNGFTELCVKVELDMKDSKKFKTFCKDENLEYIYVRRGNNNTVHYFFPSPDVDDFKPSVENYDDEIISMVRTYPLDDFATHVIQEDIIDVNYAEIAEYLNAKQKMVMKRETICVNGCWISKKNYILNVYDNEGVIYKKPKTKVTGIIKSNNPQFIRNKLTEFIHLLLSFNDRKAKESKNVMNDFVVGFKKEFMDLEPQMVGQNIKINHLNDRIGMDGLPIKGASANSVAAIYYNKYIKDNNLKSFEYIKQGDKMRYVYLEQHNPFNTHIFGYLGDSLPDAVSKYVDMEKMWETDFASMLDIILSSSGVELDYSRVSNDIMDWL